MLRHRYFVLVRAGHAAFCLRARRRLAIPLARAMRYRLRKALQLRL